MIAPVFAYRWQMIVFFPLLAFFMLLPFVDKPSWMERGILYRSIKMNDSYRSNIFYDILTEPKDIDVLFVGSSTLSAAVNPIVVKAALRSATGKENTIYTIYHPRGGFDFDYIIIKDILKRHKVKLLVWDGARPPINDQKYHPSTPYIWDYTLHRDISSTMHLDTAQMYLFSVMTGPKLLLSPILYIGNSIQTKGSNFLCNKNYYLGACLRYGEAINGTYVDSQSNIHYPAPPLMDISHLLHFRGNDMSELRNGKPYRSIDYEMLKKVLTLAEEYNTSVAFLLAPIKGDPEHVITVPVIHNNTPGWNVPIIAATLYNVLNGTNIKLDDFFQKDHTHLLYNATNYYTEMLLPAIIQIYEESIDTGIQVPPTNAKAIAMLRRPPPQAMHNDINLDTILINPERWLDSVIEEQEKVLEKKPGDIPQTNSQH